MLPRLGRFESGKHRCGWHGAHRGQVAVGVGIGWPCGHSQGPATATCVAHLDHLLSQGGKAVKAVGCPVCGTPGAATVVETHDLKTSP